MITVDKARAWVARFADRRILVVGDMMLDRYVMGTVTRISPEAPVPVVRVNRERAVPGGAANVAHNVQALGGKALLAGYCGIDPDGGELMRLLTGGGIDVDGVVQDAGVTTTVKTRIIAERQQVVRVDREDTPLRHEVLEEQLCARLRRLVGTVHGVIVEDYGKGVLTQRVVDSVLAGARAAGIPAGLDPNNTALAFSWMSLATPNYAEACAAAGIVPTPLGIDPGANPILVQVGEILSRKWNCDLLAITLGPHGMYLVKRGAKPMIIPARAREVYDVSGAGDTVIATMMLAIAAGADYLEAAALANNAAGVVVSKIGTATCSPAELLAAVQEA